MQQKILKMIKPESKHGHRTVSVFLYFGSCSTCHDLARHARPDEGDADDRQERRHSLGARQTRIFQVEPSGFQRGVQIFCLPAQGIPAHVRQGVPPIRQVQHVTGCVFRGRHSQIHTVDAGLAMPDPDFTHLKVLEDRPDRHAVRADRGASWETNAGCNPVLVEESKPVLPNEFTIREQAPDLPIWAELQEALHERFPDTGTTGPTVREQCPHQRQTEPVPHGREQENIDVLLAKFPVGAIENEVDWAGREKGQGESGEQCLRKRELDEPAEPLIPSRQRAREGNMRLHAVQDNGARLNDRQDQGREDDEAASVHRESRPQGGLQGIVRWSAPKGFHRRNTVQEPTFCCLLCVLKSSQAANTALFRIWSDRARPERIMPILNMRDLGG